MADWRTALLKRLGAPVTPQNQSFLGGWQRWEGGHTNNDATYNWLNTTRDGVGATGDINSVGVTAFDSFQNGIGATAATLQSGRYGDIIKALKSGNPYKAKPVAGLSTWLTGQAASEAGAKYASKVLGTKISAAREQASVAYDESPAAVVNNPNPYQMVALRQQQVGTLLAMSAATVAGQVANPMLISQLQQSSMALRQAQVSVAQSETAARATGGTTAAAEGAYKGVKADGKMGKILQIAAKQIGKPYVWGAETPGEGGFDCSGLIDYAFRQAGVPIPGGRLTTYTAAKLGVSVKGKQYQPGDWIIMEGGGHMVMYVGGGQVIAAPRTGEVVQYQPLSRFEGRIGDVRRFLNG